MATILPMVLSRKTSKFVNEKYIYELQQLNLGGGKGAVTKLFWKKILIN